MHSAIEYRDSGKSNIRIYLYKDKEYMLNQLAKLPECVVSKATLSGRIVNAISSNANTQWKTLEQCITTKVVTGFHGGPALIKKKIPAPPKDIIKDRITYDKFLQCMFLMPIGSLWKQARPMGSVPI